MSEQYKEAEQFLNDIFRHAGFELQATAGETEGGCTLDIDGADSSLLRNEGGELLDALEHFVNQTFSHDLPQGQRFVCDVDSFRALRETELRAMARHAADRVLNSGVPFTFGPMNANERRIIHLTLADNESLLTESVGEGNARRLQVSLRKTDKK